MLIEMDVHCIAIDPASNTPIIVLKGKEEQTLPIWIGLLEAASIATALQDITFHRPMTHDLFKNYIEKLNMQIKQIEIYDLKDNTFYAQILFSSQEYSFTLDARPSDAIAMALRFNASIFVNDKILNSSMDEPHPVTITKQMMDTSDEGHKWADYLESLSPDAYGKYKM